MLETAAVVPYTGRCNGAAQTSARDERAPPPRLGRAARSTRGSCAERGCSSPCRCCSPRSASRGRSRCRRRRCRRRSTPQSPSSSPASSPASIPTARPGSPGAPRRRRWVADQFGSTASSRGWSAFTAQIPGRGEVELRNVVAVVRGASQRAIVIMAHRDNNGDGGGANDNASGTGALIELARAYAPVGGATLVQAQPTHTLVFVSTDGGAFGALGAARFAESSPLPRERAGGGQPRRDRGRGPAAAADRRRHGALPVSRARPHGGGTRARADRRGAAAATRRLRQLLDLGFPFTLGEQGPSSPAASRR